MTDKKLTKAQRRQAAECEKLKRNEEVEKAMAVNPWDTDLLTEGVRTNGARIGAKLISENETGALALVRFGIEWPKGVSFDSSPSLYHKYLLTISAEEYKNLSEYELQDLKG